MNILIPACGNDKQFRDEYWAKNVTEINGKTMIEHTICNYDSFDNKRFIVLLNESECIKFHTDNLVKLLTDGECNIIRVAQETKGALCTCLLAIDSINDDDELLISNNDHKFDCNIANELETIRNDNSDGGVVTFECVHPRWSYVRLENGKITEASEKRPISKNAIAGLYFFKHGKDFVESAKRAIMKNRCYEGRFYLSAAINEMILMGKVMHTAKIPSDKYHSFYEPKQIEKYEMELRRI